MLGTINPQTIKIDQQAVVYPGRDHVSTLTIKRFDGRRYAPVDLSLLTRVVLVFPGTDPVIAYDSDTLPAVFSLSGSTLTIDLSDYAMPASILPCWLIAYDAEHPSGQVLVDDNDTTLEFDFRNVSATGSTPAPVVEFVAEAPVDGKTYGRKDGAWVTLEAIVSGVASVNGQTGVVVLTAADVGALTQTAADARYERGLVAGTNITIDRANPNAPIISAAGGGGGAVASVNGQTGVVVLGAADVGADASGTAAAEAEDARFQSTGLISGGQLSINGVDNTKFDVTAGVASFSDYTNPAKSTATIVNFGPFSAVTVPTLASVNVTYIGIDSSGAIVQQTTRFTNTQRRSIVSLGAVVHSNRVNINAINTIVSVNRQLLNQFGDGIRAIGQLNLSGTVYSSVGANLQIQRSAGELFSPGANFHVNPDDPHAAIIAAQNPVTFRYRLANGTEYTDRTLVDPANYDNAGVLTAVPANRYTVQLIAVFQSGITRMQYGQVLYTHLADAVAAAQAQSMTIEANIAENGVIRGYLVVKGDATALNNTSQAVFVTLSKFGASAAVSPLSIATTDQLAEGTTNLYHTAARVRTTLLTGLSLVTNAAITAADTVLDAFGKLQAQINAHFGVGGSTHPAATTSVDGFMSAADKSKLDGVAPGAQVNVPTDLSSTPSPTSVLIASSTGADATIAAVNTTDAGVMTAADKTKLDGVATGATANSTDAFLLARDNHTGTQTASTISDFASTVRDTVLTGLSTATTTVVAATDSVLVAIGKLAGRLETAFNRANHTGTQTASTISDFDSATRAQVEAELVAGSNITITPSGSGATRQLTIASTGGSSTIATQSASSSAGALDLSATTAPVILVTLTENITSITLPAGVANQSIERRIVFTQGGAGTYTIPVTTGAWGSIVVDGGASIPQMGTGVGTVGVYVLANDNNGTWRMYVDDSLKKGGTVDGSLVFTNQRTIRASSVEANALYFEADTDNQNGVIFVRPRGTATSAGFIGHNTTDPANTARMQFYINSAALVFAQSIAGTGSYVPMIFQTGGANRMTISTTGTLAVPGVYNTTTASAANVFVDSAGLLQRSTSSEQYKRDIEPLELSYSEALLDNLQPIWYRSKCEVDNPEWGWWGFSAEQMATIDPRLVHWRTCENVEVEGEPDNLGNPTTVTEHRPLAEPVVEGVAYERITVHHHALLKAQRDRIAVLEKQVAELLALVKPQ